MPSASAESALIGSPTRSRLAVTAGLLVFVAVLGGCSREAGTPPPTAPVASVDGRSAAAQRTLAALTEALSDPDPGAAAGLGTGAGRETLIAMAGNVTALGLRAVALRYVDAPPVALDAADRTAYGSRAWLGNVELSYRLDQDRAVTRMEVAFVFAPDDTGRQLVAAVGGHGVRTPLWIAGPVTALRAPRVLVVARRDQGDDPTADPGSRYLRLARHAVHEVGLVLPDWSGTLVVEAPASEEELDAALATFGGEHAGIAAVTTTVDGSLTPETPVHVFLNPGVFDALGSRGAQVVMSHESTHVATGAAFASMPAWLLEGFADYVALAHAGIPVETAASQVLARVREKGPPRRLPTAADLAPTAPGLGARYEEAWLAARFIAVEYGEARLVDFYRSVDGGRGAQSAFRRVLGTTQADFVRRWAADVARLAGVPGA